MLWASRVRYGDALLLFACGAWCAVCVQSGPASNGSSGLESWPRGRRLAVVLTASARRDWSMVRAKKSGMAWLGAAEGTACCLSPRGHYHLIVYTTSTLAHSSHTIPHLAQPRDRHPGRVEPVGRRGCCPAEQDRTLASGSTTTLLSISRPCWARESRSVGRLISSASCTSHSHRHGDDIRGTALFVLSHHSARCFQSACLALAGPRLRHATGREGPASFWIPLHSLPLSPLHRTALHTSHHTPIAAAARTSHCTFAAALHCTPNLPTHLAPSIPQAPLVREHSRHLLFSIITSPTLAERLPSHS